MNKARNKILIASITPYFLERDVFWFSQNFSKIENLAKTQVWWKENALFLEKDERINLFELLRRLTEMGYERVQTLGAKGEFSQRGGILDIFPVNNETAYRSEFIGNRLAEIYHLEVKILKKDEEIKRSLVKKAPKNLLSTLKPGEYLVHLDHGIGFFKGYAKELGGQATGQTPTPDTTEKYFVVSYAKNDTLYVPLELENKLSRYIGFETPIVHRLGGTLWYKTKRKVKEGAIELARQLFELYARRAAVRGFQFPPDDALQRELEDSFEYIETDDQLRAIEDVKKDMESEKPMDRLICGDVGFGKTEVALRAAFKAVSAGKQVAMLAPTTILAHQHYLTFAKRLKKFPVNIALLSRLESKKLQRETIKKMREGKIDITIGTHRLIQKDVEFKNLGLVIIDEEQRYGVRQKEILKGLRRGKSLPRGDSPAGEAFYGSLPRDERSEFYGVDVLSMSATPIPRTMHLSLAGLRDISLIQTAPPGRLSVKTIVEPYSQKIVKEAIEKELERGGQVYYLHNRVETIELARRQIQKLAPQSKIGIAHGRLHEKQLIKVMDEFGAGQIDILIATTIIENGLDFPNVNTLIVANATRLGLAQSYQLRGRIGRSDKQAYAYFLYNAKNLTDIAQQRLDALKEAEALGSGYQIALRDLEIRGAGNILGREQSGSINAVGLNLYVQMLNEAVEELKK
ncbi:MAG: DEAD/DEAH box helicase [bacterium]